MEKVHKFTLDINRGTNVSNITTITGDYASHKLLITLVEDGYKPVNLEDTIVRLVVRKPDDTTVQQDCTIIDTNGVVSVLLKLNTINVKGTCKAELQLWDNAVANKRLTSAQFSFKVRKSLQDDETVISTDTFSMLQQALQDIQDLELDEQRIHEIEQAIEQLQEDIENISVGDNPQLAHKIGDLEDLIQEIKDNLESKELQLNLVNAINELHTLLNDRLDTNENNLSSHLADYAKEVPAVTNIKGYGAIGDGITDDTAAIQAAVNAGRFIYFPPGEYKVTSPITVGFDRILAGAGLNTIITTSGSVDGVFNLNSVRRVTIRDMFIYCPDGNSRMAIFLTSGSHNNTFKNIRIKGFLSNAPVERAAIYVESNCWSQYFENVLIEDSHNGFMAGSAFNNTTLINVSCTGCSKDGFNLQASHGVNFFGCRAEQNRRSGWRFQIFGGQYHLNGCFIEHNEQGVAVGWNGSGDPVDLVSITGCTFYGNKYSIDAYMAKNVVATGCRFAGLHDDGYCIRASSSSIDTDDKQVLLIEPYFRDDVGQIMNNAALVHIISSKRFGGATTHRPSLPNRFESYFDTTLGKPIWYDGSNWVDATGQVV